MKTPAALQPLIDDGVIDEVLRSLNSGKEATVYLVRSGIQIRCAKVYRDMAQRSFQKRAQYQEGRKVRGSRQARAMSKSTRYGRKEQEAAWKNAEVDALGKRAQGIYAELGKTVALSGNGGASESAVAMSVGTAALDGLGYVGEGFHTDHESIDLSTVTPRLYLFTRLLMETCRNPPAKAAGK